MKKIIGIVLVISILFSVANIFFATATYQTEYLPYISVEFDKEEVLEGEEVEVFIKLKNNDRLLLSGLQFCLNFTGSYNFYKTEEKPLPDGFVGDEGFEKLFPIYPFEMVDDSLVLGEKFEDSQVEEYMNQIMFMWTAVENSEFPVENEELIASFKLKVNDEAFDDKWQFNIAVEMGVYTEKENETVTGITEVEFANTNHYDSYDKTLYITENFRALDDKFEIPNGKATGQLILNKEVDINNTKIVDTTCAEIVSINNYEDASVIEIRGKKEGKTQIEIYPENDVVYEAITVQIEITKPKAIFIAVNKKPKIREFYVGKKLTNDDLEGIELFINYNNSEGKETSNTNDFIISEYDFSSPGEKKVKIMCDNAYSYITYNILEPEFKYDEEYVYNVPKKMSVEEFKFSFENKENVVLLDGENQITKGNIKTGMKVKFSCKDGERELLIAVKNDLNNDGNVSLKDLVILKNLTLGVAEPSSLQLKALCSNGEEPNALDLLTIKKELLGVK